MPPHRCSKVSASTPSAAAPCSAPARPPTSSKALGLPVVDVSGLEEMDVGPYEGVADYSWVAPWREDKAVNGIEPFPVVRRRVAEAANRALGTASHVLIVAHGGVFWALQHLCRAPFTPLANCRPAHLAPVGESAWRIEMLSQAGET